MDLDWDKVPTFVAKVESHNRIWIPKLVREMLNIEKGDYVEVKIRVLRKGSKILRT